MCRTDKKEGDKGEEIRGIITCDYFPPVICDLSTRGKMSAKDDKREFSRKAAAAAAAAACDSILARSLLLFLFPPRRYSTGVSAEFLSPDSQLRSVIRVVTNPATMSSAPQL